MRVYEHPKSAYDLLTMPLPVLSLIAFGICILLSCVTAINVGLLSIAFAFIVGVSFGGMTVREVAAGFPSNLFLILVGVTLLFSQAQANGTLDNLAKRSVKLARGNAGLIPIIFMGLALFLSAIGAGNIAATALLAPMAMAVAPRVGVSAFLMTIAVCTGANAGGLSPIAPTGVIANGLLARIGIEGQEFSTFFNSFVAQIFIGLMGYLIFGGYRLIRAHGTSVHRDEESDVEALTIQQKLTMGVIGALVIAVVFFGVNVGMGAFIAAGFLTLTRSVNENAALKAMPWSAIMMVSGVTVLIAILEQTGGMDLFTLILARFSNETTVTGVIAFVTGVISVYSSSSGVVLPAFIPTIPGLIEQLGGGDPIAIAASINVGSHLVDASPLSTLGALCIASAPITADRMALFNKMLAWGLSMSVVGAAVCYVFFGLL